jgi:acetyltransferase-like isoleucine patch superfamily enzyme
LYSEYLPVQQKIGFLIEVTNPETGSVYRQLVSEEELIETNSKDMYYFIRASLKFEKKVTIPKKVLMHPNFEQ